MNAEEIERREAVIAELLSTAPEGARATIKRWEAACFDLTDDPRTFVTSGESWCWYLSRQLPDGSLTGRCYRLDVPDRETAFKVRPSGLVERGIPWLRRRAIGTGG